VQARSQTQLAVSTGAGWYLIGASPDLRAQILADAELQPRATNQGVARETPITGVILTGADVDAVAGLLHLREFQPMQIHATDSIIRILTDQNSIFGALQQSPNQAAWIRVRPGEAFPVAAPIASSSREQKNAEICCELLPLDGDFPAYVTRAARLRVARNEAVSGVILESASGKKLAFLPSVARLDNSWRTRLESCDVLLFDGTFWSDDELVRIRGEGKTATEMGHIPISGKGGSLAALANLRHPRKMFIHINNTNPILDPESAEHHEVIQAGWEIADDRMEFEL
jgi:pyrroloquinoline quinone biosynthesis protein B